jgi:NAD(P)-dependent dehydrogenase (short-subunit alcohol dehydrogenase family)
VLVTNVTPPAGTGRLAGRVVVVTGGNRGIGLAMAEACASAGADVAIWGRDAAKNDEAQDRLSTHGARVEAVVCDVSQQDSVHRAMSATVELLGRVDTMVANAGIKRMNPFLDVTLEEWQAVTRVNLDGTFLTLQAAAQHMVERGEGGALIAVSSLSAYDGSPSMEHYAASKAGALALIRSLAVELAKYRIRCNALVPGWIETEMTADWISDPRMLDAVSRRTPVRRWGTVDELGPALVFLADPAYEFHTGTTMIVDGGYSVA